VRGKNLPVPNKKAEAALSGSQFNRKPGRPLLFQIFRFFADELIALFNSGGYSLHPVGLNIILPVGISFYTFQTLSYTIDIYRERLKPTDDRLAFFTFVGFFPQLVAGPIERAKNLLPQFSSLKTFDYERAANGFRQLLWGFFAKIAVADTVAPIVDNIFAHSETADAATLALGAVLFSIQIFGDFAGYSNIAIGLAALLGFDLIWCSLENRSTFFIFLFRPVFK